MKKGTENRNKTIAVGVLGMIALLAFLWQIWGLLGGSSAPPTPPPSVIPAASTTTTSSTHSASAGSEKENGTQGGLGAAPGVAATKLAESSAGLDPTLHEDAMLRTERLEYSGSGRNIFSATFVPTELTLPTNVPPARIKKGPTLPPPPPPPPPTCPPTCPPIKLKFFGTEKFHDGKMEGFFLDGDDVYLAAQGDIVARKYKIVSIVAGSAQVEDLSNTYTQALPLQMQ